MTQHGIKEVYNVDNTRSSDSELSSKQPNATSSELLDEHALIVAHITVSVNLNKKR
jgi:hypothetical protein